MKLLQVMELLFINKMKIHIIMLTSVSVTGFGILGIAWMTFNVINQTSIFDINIGIGWHEFTNA
ncbi:MAG TPA: hypothetical protein VE226_03960 [Nitrososphaeraceae archaeon]|nr:hypothetical protein [Nitrososphaeraceae archaeon]